MGIDIYAKWDAYTEANYEAQLTGFDTTAGSVGYLREAYHGGPYVTNWLMPEAFAIGENEGSAEFFSGGVETFMASIFGAIGASMPEAVVKPSLADVAYRAGDGFPPAGYIVQVPEVEVVHPKYPDEKPSICAAIPAALLERRLPLCEAIYAERCKRVYNAEPGADEWQSFVGFVALIREKEDAGLHPSVYASY